MMMHNDPASEPELRFNNMALAVGDLRGMVWWYRRVLGLRLVRQGHFDGVGADYAFLDGEGFRLELVSRAQGQHQPVARTQPPMHLNELGWKALVLETDDLDALETRLSANAVECVWSRAPLTDHRHSTMIRDPEGNLIHVFGPEMA
jgi:catechol 2,3-dioxygenase-like lactoylglutathione lyase family enzyme